MSGKVTGAVWEMDLPRPVKYLLLALAEHANHEGEQIHPGVELLAWKTGYTGRNVQRMLRELEGSGIIVPEDGHKIGRGRVVHYRIDFDAAPKLAPRQRKRVTSPHTSERESGEERVTSPHNGPKPEKGDIPAQERVTSPRKKGDISSGAPASVEKLTVKEPSLGTVRERENARDPRPIPDDFAISAAMATWAAELGLAPAVVAAETDKFVDHFRGTGGRKKDWVAAWRNWLRRVDEFAPARNRPGPPADHRPPAPPNGTVPPTAGPTTRRPKMLYQTFDLDANDYVPLDEPIPDTDPRYAAELAASRERVREAGRRDREQT